MVGWLAERGWTGAVSSRSFAAHFAANIFCLALGGVWLATLIGSGKGADAGRRALHPRRRAEVRARGGRAEGASPASQTGRLP